LPDYRAELRAYRVPGNESANDLGSIFPPVGVIGRVNPNNREFTFPHTFWFKRVSSFRLLLLTMFYQWFTFVSLVILPLAPLRLLLADLASPRGSAYSFLRVLFPSASHKTITRPACGGGAN